MQIVKTTGNENRKREIRLDDFRVIARQRRPGCWEPTDDCPFSDYADPLAMVRKAVDNGQMVMAQRRVGAGQYDLVIKPARHRR